MLVPAARLKVSRTTRPISAMISCEKLLGKVVPTTPPRRWTVKQPEGRRSTWSGFCMGLRFAGQPLSFDLFHGLPNMGQRGGSGEPNSKGFGVADEDRQVSIRSKTFDIFEHAC